MWEYPTRPSWEEKKINLTCEQKLFAMFNHLEIVNLTKLNT